MEVLKYCKPRALTPAGVGSNWKPCTDQDWNEAVGRISRMQLDLRLSGEAEGAIKRAGTETISKELMEEYAERCWDIFYSRCGN